jgi:hypothetical protein
MSEHVDWNEVLALLDTMYSASDRLDVLFLGRKFTLDGHLVGSFGEVIAAYMFDLNLLRGSNKWHDTTARDGRNFEVKLTQGKSVSIRHEPDHLIVLQRREGTRVTIAFNGPGALAWTQAGKIQDIGQRPISLAMLRRLDEGVAVADRLAQIREAPV